MKKKRITNQENRRVSKHADFSAEIKATNENDLFNIINESKFDPFILILDQVQDPHNLGACLRSASAAGVDVVIAPKDRSVGLTSTVVSIASGAAEKIPFIQVTNLARTIEELKKYGLWLIGTSDDSSENIFETDLTGPIAIVMGSEGKGLRRLTKERCDRLIKIPMAETSAVECLNVSVATGITLYEVVKQRQKK